MSTHQTYHTVEHWDKADPDLPIGFEKHSLVVFLEMQGFVERFAETTTYYRQGKQDGDTKQGGKQQQDRVDSGYGTGRSKRLVVA